MTSGRRESRELALQVLFQLEFTRQELEQALNNFKQAFSASPDTWNYAMKLLECVEKKRTEIDQLIQNHTAHWRIERLALVDLNILRLTTAELKFMGAEVPPAAAINEAIELARKYGTTDSAKFVNGVLDQIHKA